MDETQLHAAYRFGDLHPALRLLVEAQSAIAEESDEAGIEDSIGGTFLEEEIPTPMRADALDRALEEVRATEIDDLKGQRSAARAASEILISLEGVPDPLMDLAINAAAGRGWRKPAPHVQRLELMRDGPLSAELIRVKAGTGVPPHGHGGMEYTLCLSGLFKQQGRTYGRGDMVIAGGGDVHAPQAEPGEDVLVFAVTEAPLRYRGLVGLAQKIFRFR